MDITITEYNDTFELFCEDLLNMEGLAKDGQMFRTQDTLIFMRGSEPVGFMSYFIKDDLFWVQHFVIATGHRNDTLRGCIKQIRKVVRGLGFQRLCCYIGDWRPYFNKIIQIHFKVRPCDYKQNRYYYSIPLGEQL